MYINDQTERKSKSNASCIASVCDIYIYVFDIFIYIISIYVEIRVHGLV